MARGFFTEFWERRRPLAGKLPLLGYPALPTR
jgi:hypothetical protein